jgi:hypothetical protein
MPSESKVGPALRALEGASRADLMRQWRRLYRSEPPRYASLDFLRRAVAYAVQEQALGGLPKPAQRELLAIAAGRPSTGATAAIKIKPGIRLLREWRGTTHEVLVTDKGFVWDGTTYRSLSAVAATITGAKWSGHRFFGLKRGRGGENG